MKDVTSTSFGLLIAFLLPGLAALYAFSLWPGPIQSLFQVFLTAESNVGLFLLVILAAIALGIQVTAIRWVLFELLFCRRHRLSKEAFSNLGDPGKLAAFRAATDEHYRYHQFWGGLTIVLPILYLGLRSPSSNSAWAKSCWTAVVFMVLEVITFAAAIEAYSRYASRANKILQGGKTMPNGWGEKRGFGKKKRSAAKKKRPAAKKKRPAAKKKRAAKK
jgi:hypothetical protein